jgi:hypothetical protein
VSFDVDCNSAGEWSDTLDLATLATPSALEDGAITVSAKQTDTAGNEGNATSKTVNKDTATLGLAITTPTSIIVNKSNYESFALTGTCGAVGQSVDITEGDNTNITPDPTKVLCGPGGTWIAYLNFTGSDAANTGAISVDVNHMDSYGNAAGPATQALTFDITPPSAPKITLSSPATSPGSDSTPALTVTATAGNYEATDKVTLHLVAGCLDTAVSNVANGDGDGSVDVDVVEAMVEGQVLKYYARVEDEAGNISCSSADAANPNPFVTYKLDTVAPVVRIGSLDPISDETSYTVSGTCSVGDGDVTVKLVDGAATPNEVEFSDVDCNTAGEWSKEFTALSTLIDGTITVSAKQTDAAGNEGTATEKTVNKDTLTLVSLDSSDDSIGFGGGTKSNVEWDSTNNYLKLSTNKTYGVFTSRVMDYKSAHTWSELYWKTTMPFGKELTNASELTTDYSGVSTDLMSDAVAIWHMNDDVDSDSVADAITNATTQEYNLELNGDVLLGEQGKLSKSVRFNHGYLKLDGKDLVTPAFSIQAWIKPDYSSLTGNRVILQQKYTEGFVFSLEINAGQLVFKVSDDASVVAITSATSPVNKLPVGKWSHIIAVFDGTLPSGNIKIYINNVAEGTATFTDNLFPGSGTVTNLAVYLGGDEDSTKNFKGYIDEVAVWGRALSDDIANDEITQLYRRGVNRLKFQVRGCSNSTCTGAAWVGPNGTSSSYFSELINNAEIDASTLDPLGEVSAFYPIFSFTDYLSAGLNAINSQYIQYRAIFETDDPDFSPELEQVEIVQ